MIEKEKVKKVIDYVGDKELAFFNELTDLNRNLKPLPELLKVVEGLDARELEQLQGEKGEKGDQGEKGEAGEPGSDGLDGVNGKDGKDGRDGINGIDGRDGRDGKQGKDGKSLDAKEVVETIKSLKGDERIDISAIKNTDKLVFQGKKGFNGSDQRWHGAGITSVLAGTNIVVTQGATSSTVTVSSTGGISGSYVATLNALTGSVSLVGSTNITITPVGNTLQIASSGGGVVSLNGLTGSTQLFATGLSGTDFNIVSAANTHTFNIPTASATNPSRGLLSGTDWITFNGKAPSDAQYVVMAANAGLSNERVLTAGSAIGVLDGGAGNPVTIGNNGVWGISKAGSAALTGTVTLTGSTNVILTQAGQDISVAVPSVVTSINKTGSAALIGAVTLTGSTNVTLTQVGNDISIAAAGGAASITGTDTYVLFFDGANNPAGDSGLTYNKGSDILTIAGGIVAGTTTLIGTVTNYLRGTTLHNGNIVFHPDNTHTIGASGLNRPSKIWTVAADTGTLNVQQTAVIQGAGGASLDMTGAGGWLNMTAGNQGVYWGGSGGGRIWALTSQTPDTMALTTGSLGNSIIVCEDADTAFDFAHAQQANPTIFVHSATQSGTQWISLTHNGTNGIIDVGTGVVNFPDTVTISTPGTTAGSAVTIDGSQTLSNKTLTAPIINTGTVGTSLVPTSNDGAPLGDTTHQFSDLFLAEGGVINWDNGDATITQVGNAVTVAGADFYVPDEAYSVSWDGNLSVPTKNAVYDKVETLSGGGLTMGKMLASTIGMTMN